MPPKDEVFLKLPTPADHIYLYVFSVCRFLFTFVILTCEQDFYFGPAM